MTRLIFALLAPSLLLLSAGCGQSGPLYLPGNPSQIQTPSATTPDSDEEKE
ncbi:MAG: lipoprotein, partial [Gammaproteobacteria bacterium]|nr:lipoprotein [Gammaproteobacteria bacterium]